jgi:hypothetical protein
MFLKALVIMIVRHLQKVNELLSVLAQPTAEMALLPEQGSFPSHRTWESRQISDPAALACPNRLLGPPFGGTNPPVGQFWPSRGHR